MNDFTFTMLAKPNTGDYYEGNAAWLRSIHPRPVVSQARIEGQTYPANVVFREDSYEPTARIRRGRFYNLLGPLQIGRDRVTWHPFPPPYLYGPALEQRIEFSTVFEQNEDLNRLVRTTEGYAVIIGMAPAETRWRVIDAETLSDGTTLFTLKAISTFGLLPVLTTADPDIIKAADNVVETALRQSAASIADVCRESSRVVLAKHLASLEPSSQKKVGGDLGDLIKKLPQSATMRQSAARIINRFHSRTKSAVMEEGASRDDSIRPIHLEDAMLAVRLFGFLLVEMKFASH